MLVRSQLEREGGGLFRRVTEHDVMLLTSIDIQSICILSPVHLACNEHLIGAPLPLRLVCWDDWWIGSRNGGSLWFSPGALCLLCNRFSLAILGSFDIS